MGLLRNVFHRHRLDGSPTANCVPVPWRKGEAENLTAVGFFNRDTRDSFIGLFLDHTAENVQGLKHTGAPLFYYKWHGHVWSRALFQNATLPAGAVLRQRNAYLTSPFPEQGAAGMIEGIRHRMMNPLIAIQRIPCPSGFQASVALPAGSVDTGEVGDSPISKKALWEAIGNLPGRTTLRGASQRCRSRPDL